MATGASLNSGIVLEIVYSAKSQAVLSQEQCLCSEFKDARPLKLALCKGSITGDYQIFRSPEWLCVATNSNPASGYH